MSRPKRAGLGYFPLDTGFFEDKRIRRLMSRFGADGPLFYIYILCKVYDNGYYVEHSEDFNEDAALDLGCSAEKIGLMLHYLLDKSLLDSTLFSTVGEFETTAQLNTTNEFRNYTGYGYATTTSTHMLHALCFTPKNDNDLVILCVYEYIYNSSNHTNNTIGSQVYSVSQGVFGTYDSTSMLKIQGSADKEQYMLFYDILCSGKVLPMEKNTIPIAANGECLINVAIEDKHPAFFFARYNPQTIMNKRTITDVTLPSRAKLFKESVCYASTQGLWFIFVGTGLLFGESVVDGPWGYLDTQTAIGAITRFACLDYNIQKNELCISGMDSTGIPRVWKLALPDLYSYASDGAWLPMLESDGVPAYIKARST